MFYEIRFPDSISIKSTAKLEFDTSIVSSKNGKEQRIANRNDGKMVFDVVSGIKTKKDLEEIASFFRIVKGRNIGFRFKDWFDFSVKNQMIGLGNGEEKNFQLVKSYDVLADEKHIIYVRKITKPVKNTIKIFVDDREVDLNLFNINYTSGEITFKEAPEDGKIVSADFEFDLPVRFDDDSIELNLDSINSGKIKNIRLVEIL